MHATETVMDERPGAGLAAANLAWIAGVAATLSACGGSDGAPPPQMFALDAAVSSPDLLGPPAPAAQAAQAAAVFDATALMDWAQTAYPAFFPSAEVNRVADPYVYRYYPQTGNYLGVAGSEVYVLGPVSAGLLAHVGSLTHFACVADQSGCALAPSTAAAAARFLAQATLGAPKSEISNLQLGSYPSWLEAQFALPRSQSHFDWLMAKGYSAETYRNNVQGLDNTIWRKLISSTDLLRQRVTLALSEICVVSVLGVNGQWRQFTVANYLDILEANAFGNYRTLLEQVSLSTAMGFYLTFRGNAKANALTGSQPDENYARELMQLFTIGLLQLNPDGTASGGESYGQDDVSGLARVFTGWDLDITGQPALFAPEVQRRPMAQVASRYETGSKTFLGVTIAAGTTAAAGLGIALDTLFNHPNLPPFVSRQLIQRLVTSNPSAAYVGRVAAVFANNGAGVRGDLKAVVKAILLDLEARDTTHVSEPAFGKLREPVVRFLNWARGFGATSTADAWDVGDLSDPASKLGQSPLRSASVFNFFRPGYVPPNTAIATLGLTGPEFQITTESSVAGYVNFMQRALSGAGVGDLRANYTSLLALVTDSAALLDEINLVLAAGQVSGATLATLKTALDTIAVTTDAGKLNRVHAGLTLMLAAPEFIAQK